MAYTFIARRCGDLPVAACCRVMGVPTVTCQWQYGADGRPLALIEEDPATTLEPVTGQKQGLLSFAAPPATFFGAWRWDAWNTLKIRCEGRYPVLTTWVNGVRAYQMDSGSIRHPHYEREAVAALLGRQGHIALEVHDTDSLGEIRWGEGARCRWRNIKIAEL